MGPLERVKSFFGFYFAEEEQPGALRHVKIHTIALKIFRTLGRDFVDGAKLGALLGAASLLFAYPYIFALSTLKGSLIVSIFLNTLKYLLGTMALGACGGALLGICQNSSTLFKGESQ